MFHCGTHHNIRTNTDSDCSKARTEHRKQTKLKNKNHHGFARCYMASFVEKDLVVMVDTKQHLSQRWALITTKANGILSYIRQSITSRSGEMIFPLYSALVRSHWNIISSSGHASTIQDIQNRVQLEHLPSEDRVSWDCSVCRRGG